MRVSIASNNVFLVTEVDSIMATWDSHTVVYQLVTGDTYGVFCSLSLARRLSALSGVESIF